MKILQLVIAVLLLFLFVCFRNGGEREFTVWDIDNLEEIGRNKVTVLSTPLIIDTPKGNAVQFDGVDDGIFLDTNLLTGAHEFTVEIIFRPDLGGNKEERFK